MPEVADQRDQSWLENLFTTVWQQYFHDVEPHNLIRVEFGRRAKRRLGSISLDRHDSSLSVIRVNGLFKDPEIPKFIVAATLVHELCHYVHGFNSGAKQPQHRYPHSGGVIRKEFAERGLESLYHRQQAWLKNNWPRIVAENFPQKSKIYNKRKIKLSIFG